MRLWVVLALVTGSYGVAAADDDHAKAEALFAEAQKLRDAGDTVAACKKFEEALSYNRTAVGTLLNVGMCNEVSGRYATAVQLYTQARDLAREHSFWDHLAAAEERLAIVTPLVGRVSVTFAEKHENMKLVIGEKVIPIDQSGDIVIDPGRHHVVVTAPSRLPYDTWIEVERGGRASVAVPKLETSVTVQVEGTSRETVGKVLTFSGAALVASGIGLGLYARSEYHGQIGTNCTDTDPPVCNAEGYRITNDARTLGTFGTIVGVAGVGLLGAGAYLWYSGRKSPMERAVAIVPTVDPHSAGLTAIGRF